ncbi:MAG: lasso peptide biosynthesis B2 protein [Cyanobacteria bacterium P01_H01_bin.15]
MGWWKFILRKMRHGTRLFGIEGLWFVRDWILLGLITLSLKGGGYRRTRQWLKGLAGTSDADGVNSDLPVKNICRQCAIARRNFPWNTCLRGSLLLWFLLRCQGFESEICFGSAYIDAKFSAHAWVELGGRVLNDRPDIRSQYQVFACSPDLFPL